MADRCDLTQRQKHHISNGTKTDIYPQKSVTRCVSTILAAGVVVVARGRGGSAEGRGEGVAGSHWERARASERVPLNANTSSLSPLLSL